MNINCKCNCDKFLWKGDKSIAEVRKMNLPVRMVGINRENCEAGKEYEN